MRRDKNDTRGRIPPEQLQVIHGGNDSGKTLEQNWALTEAKVYDALWRLKEIHNRLLPIHDCHQRIQADFAPITPIEMAAIHLYGHWIVYGWATTKAMVREIYPGIVNKNLSNTISGIGDL